MRHILKKWSWWPIIFKLFIAYMVSNLWIKSKFLKFYQRNLQVWSYLKFNYNLVRSKTHSAENKPRTFISKERESQSNKIPIMERQGQTTVARPCRFSDPVVLVVLTFMANSISRKGQKGKYFLEALQLIFYRKINYFIKMCQ